MLRTSWRTFNTLRKTFRPPSSYPNRNGFFTAKNVARVTLLTASSLVVASTIYADSDSDETKQEKSKRPSLRSLVRAYTVYSICSIPSLVDASPKILTTLTSVPGLKHLTEAIVRITFFDQFVGADSAEDALPLLHNLRAANKGVLFAYSVEVDEAEATGAGGGPSAPSERDNNNSPSNNVTVHHAHGQELPFRRIVDETIHCIDVAANFESDLVDGVVHQAPADGANGKGRRTWVAIKMTALLPDAHALIGLSKYIVQQRKDRPDNQYVPFPGSARMEDLEDILKGSSDPHLGESLTPRQVEDLRQLFKDLVRVCQRAQERGVKVIVDAEYTWYQPAIDALTLALMRKFNALDTQPEVPQVQPLIYGTFQAYLRRTPIQLALAIQDAKKLNYSLGVKLVRGAYHPHEVAAHKAALEWDAAHSLSPSQGASPAVRRHSLSISPDKATPVWEQKAETDHAYNVCAVMLVEEVKKDVEKAKGSYPPVSRSKEGLESGYKSRWLGGILGERSYSSAPGSSKKEGASPGIGVLFGTHNWDSCRLVLKTIRDTGLGEEVGGSLSALDPPIKIVDDAVERIAIGQLYGMSDELTDWVVRKTVSTHPFVIKYVPYGALSEVMPYLSRRAIENKSVLGDGAAARERQRAGREIWKRLFG